MDRLCPVHNEQLVNRKGISKKTNKPFNFWSCPVRENNKFCDYTENDKPTKSVATQDSGVNQQILDSLEMLKLAVADLRDLILSTRKMIKSEEID